MGYMGHTTFLVPLDWVWSVQLYCICNHVYQSFFTTLQNTSLELGSISLPVVWMALQYWHSHYQCLTCSWVVSVVFKLSCYHQNLSITVMSQTNKNYCSNVAWILMYINMKKDQKWIKIKFKKSHLNITKKNWTQSFWMTMVLSPQTIKVSLSSWTVHYSKSISTAAVTFF